MNPDEKRARLLAEELKEWVGATLVQGSVIFIGPGAPYTAQFTMYDDVDLRRARDLGLLHERTLKIHGATRTDEIAILASNGGPKKET
jgi:hypothetical protein